MKFKQDSVSEKHQGKRTEDPNAKNGIRIEYSYVDINTLEELLEYVKKEGHPVIITDYDDTPELETYDDYRE